MIRPTALLADLEARYGREAFRDLSYEEALGRITALWVEARVLNPDLGRDWQEDLASTLAVARAVNGLSPTTRLF